MATSKHSDKNLSIYRDELDASARLQLDYNSIDFNPKSFEDLAFGNAFSQAGYSNGIYKNSKTEDLLENELNYLNQIQLKAYDQWYNSEENKVARLRSAGLNPDLMGLEQASESSPLQQTPSPEGINVKNQEIASARMNSFLTQIPQVLLAGVGFVNNMKTSKSLSLQNDFQGLINEGQYLDNYNKYHSHLSRYVGTMKDEDFNNLLLDKNVGPVVLAPADFGGFSDKGMSNLQNVFDSMKESDLKKIRNDYKAQQARSFNIATQLMSDPYFKDNQVGFTNHELKKIYQIAQQADKAKNQFVRDFYNNRDGQLEGEATTNISNVNSSLATNKANAMAGIMKVNELISEEIEWAIENDSMIYLGALTSLQGVIMQFFDSAGISLPDIDYSVDQHVQNGDTNIQVHKNE